MRTRDSGMIVHCPVLDAPSGHSVGGRVCGCAIRVWLVLVAGWGLLLAGPAQAAEPVRAFVDGLRDRGYYDTALAYLDQLEQQGKLPVELKELLPYERAQTLLASARDLNNVDAQRQQRVERDGRDGANHARGDAHAF